MRTEIIILTIGKTSTNLNTSGVAVIEALTILKVLDNILTI